jgi:hypothetical protein
LGVAAIVGAGRANSIRTGNRPAAAAPKVSILPPGPVGITTGGVTPRPSTPSAGDQGVSIRYEE